MKVTIIPSNLSTHIHPPASLGMSGIRQSILHMQCQFIPIDYSSIILIVVVSYKARDEGKCHKQGTSQLKAHAFAIIQRAFECIRAYLKNALDLPLQFFHMRV